MKTKANETKPEITLKSIKLHKGLSQETPAYTAKLYVDGKYFGTVENAGHGGADHVRPTKGKTWEDVQALFARVAKTYPKIECGGHVLDESLETICHGIVWDSDEKKRLKRQLNSKVILADAGKLYTLKAKPTPQVLEQVRTKYPDNIILNALTFEAAWEIYDEITRKTAA